MPTTYFRIDLYNFRKPLRPWHDGIHVTSFDDLAGVLKNIPPDYDMVLFTSEDSSIMFPASHFEASVIIPDPAIKQRAN